MAQRLERWATQGGQAISARRLNQVVDTLNDLLTPGGAPSDQPNGFPSVAELEITSLAPSEGTGFVTAQGAGVGTITVELPPDHYEASRGATTYTYTDNNNRTANPGAVDEDLTPPLAVGDKLLCVWLSAPVSGTKVRWRDLNRTGRMWAEVVPP